MCICIFTCIYIHPVCPEVDAIVATRNTYVLWIGLASDEEVALFRLAEENAQKPRLCAAKEFLSSLEREQKVDLSQVKSNLTGVGIHWVRSQSLI